jgi:RNA polymerase sigma-70 factor (ECF subfamily)
VEEFEAHREHLTGVAYRMLGSRAEAEDAVQEAWLRYSTADRPGLADPRAWLTTVTARICLDVLRSARVRREAYVGPWLPEPLVERLPATFRLGSHDADDPADRVARLDRISLALLVVLERLSPEQRVAFVLHDVFAVPFTEIAAVLGGTPAAARQLASRARRAVADGSIRHTADLHEQRRVLTAFVAAAERGDIQALVGVLAPDAVATGDGGGAAPAARRPVTGALHVARFFAGLFRRAGHAERTGLATVVVEPVLVNGDLGLLVEAVGEAGPALRVVMGFAVADGRITAVYDQLNPAKLGHVPAADPARTVFPLTR